jgi:hypothetical protein
LFVLEETDSENDHQFKLGPNLLGPVVIAALDVYVEGGTWYWKCFVEDRSAFRIIQLNDKSRYEGQCQTQKSGDRQQDRSMKVSFFPERPTP